jgi:hypothetical protein
MGLDAQGSADIGVWTMTAAPSPSSSGTDELRVKVAVALMNSVREHHGLDPITWDFPAISSWHRKNALRDADAAIAAMRGVAQEALDTQLVTALHQIDGLYNREGYDAGQLDRLDRELKAIRSALLQPVAQAPSVQHGADYLFDELEKLGNYVTYTACKVLVSRLYALASPPAALPAGEDDPYITDLKFANDQNIKAARKYKARLDFMEAKYGAIDWDGALPSTEGK